MTSFLRVEAAIEVCTRHLEKLDRPDPEIDTVLAAHIAAVAYAVFEKHIRDLIVERCRHPTDEPINRFADVAAQRLVRSIKVTDLAGFLGFFGSEEKEAFQRRLRREPEVEAAWGNLLAGRHGIAHDAGAAPTMTLADVMRDVKAAEQVVQAFESALTGAAG